MKLADNEWGGLEAAFVTTLREQHAEPVPEQIIRYAQMSYDGRPHPDNPALLLHAMQYEFETPERAQAFARHMRNAGAHTRPPSSVTVVVDPQRRKTEAVDADGQPVVKDGKPVMVLGPAVNPRLVAWRAGARRGRGNASA
jgi:hypothetical protein